MVWTIVILIISSILFKFLYSLIKDHNDLLNLRLSTKFNYLVDELNETAFHGEGGINETAKKEFNLHRKGSNQIIYFLYGSGSLTIIWKLAIGDDEIIHKERFRDVRDLSINDQERIALAFIIEMHKKLVHSHRSNPFAAQLEKYIQKQIAPINKKENKINDKYRKFKSIRTNSYRVSVEQLGEIIINRSRVNNMYTYVDMLVLYDSEGRIIERNNYCEPLRITYYEYNNKGNLINETQRIDWGEGKPIIKDEKRFIYNNSFILIELNEYTNDKLSQRTTYEYDNDGYLICTNFYSSEFGLIKRQSFKYDNAGNKTETTCYDSYGHYQSKTYFKYDDVGNLLEEYSPFVVKTGTIINDDEQEEVLINDGKRNRTIYKYDKSGNIIEYQQSVDAASYKGTEICIKTTTGKVHSFTYNFDDSNNWVSKMEFINSEPFQVIERIIEYQ